MATRTDPPYIGTAEGRDRLSRIPTPLLADHRQGCELVMHDQFERWAAAQGGPTADVYTPPPHCTCASF